MAQGEKRAGRAGSGGGWRPSVAGQARREAVSTVAVVPDAERFALMHQYSTFVHPDHATYLRRMDALLRALAGENCHTSVALFDPRDYKDYCADEGLDPDCPTSRGRYTAEVAACGATIRYDGERLERLLPVLLATHDRWSTWERGAELLSAAGACGDCAKPLAGCAFQRAARTLGDLLRWAGTATHHLVCSVVAQNVPLTAALHARQGASGGVLGADAGVFVEEPEALLMCTVLAAGLATGGAAGLVLRSEAVISGAPEEVRGWRLEGGRLVALSEAEVFAAYCTDALTGEPVPPEGGVSYREAGELPHHTCHGG